MYSCVFLIEDGTLVVATATNPPLFDKTMSNVKEVKARGGFVTVCGADDGELSAVCDELIPLPRLHPLLSPIAQTIPLQLFAYYVAAERGCDIDKPRNLAKSVTVE